MASDYFDFKQFRVYHNRCAQKVGTDGVVLGAWADICNAKRILDVGTGSGLIALMAAQRVPESMVCAIDIDHDAVLQARENVAASPFSDRIRVFQVDVRDFVNNRSALPESDLDSGKDVMEGSICGVYEDASLADNLVLSDAAKCKLLHSFDHIICNPPFYTEDTLPPDSQRALARNAALLPFEDLITAVGLLLNEHGSFSVMLPISCRDSFSVMCEANLLHVVRECTVQTVKRKAPKRILITYSKDSTECVEKESIILQEGNEKSEEYKFLARDFYL